MKSESIEQVAAQVFSFLFYYFNAVFVVQEFTESSPGVKKTKKKTENENGVLM